MNTVTSNDGTTIAFEQVGAGAPVILVSGATQYRAIDQNTPKLASLLSQRFSVISYDRRGRGESSDTLPFAVEREIEDIEALIDAAGGSAFVYGISSGAALAMEATLQLVAKLKKLAMYEAPYNSEEGARAAWKDYRKNLSAALAENRQGDAVACFMKVVGVPDDQVAGMRHAPFWGGLEAIAPTLAYDAAELGDEAAVPTERAARVTVPTLVMDGGASYPFMHTTALALAEAMPQGQQRTLEGQTHDVSPDVLAPALIEFFSA
ncbi:MAG: alpha/beta hydrolase [Chloroflexota bacterium]